ncbi:MAG: hypothetical protein HQ500_05025 [Flavobacteriales bacterium]|nr:hypothetical protein [Flavobacteriales bacterium]
MSDKVKLTVQLTKSESNLMWYYTINVSEEVAQPFIDGLDRRVICTLPDGDHFHCALFASKQGGYNILLNKQRRDRLGLRTGSVFEIILEKDTTKYGSAMSDEFAAVLEQDEDGGTIFHGLTPGKQRALIYFSDNVKSSDIKIRRALVVMRHLSESEGDLDYKRLSTLIKEANQSAKLK